MNRNTFFRYINSLNKELVNFEFKHHGAKHSKGKLVNKMNNEILYQNFEYMLPVIKKSKALLDFGFGMGDKAYLLRCINKTAKIDALDTRLHDDIDDTKEATKFLHSDLSRFLHFVGKKYKIHYTYYNGRKLPYKTNSFDTIMAYAVLEHIGPEHRENIMKELYRVLKPEGHLLIVRLPRYFSIAEFLARKLDMEAHPWVLKKSDVYTFLGKRFTIQKIRLMDSTFCFPAVMTNFFYPILKPIDNICTATQLNFWAHDYSLITKSNKKTNEK